MNAERYIQELNKIQEFLDNSELTIHFTSIKKELMNKTTNSINDITIYSDGACRGNPGPGSWACFAKDQSQKILFEKTGVETKTTNNKMEMVGVIEGLKGLLQLKLESKAIEFFTDSKYVVSGIKEWMPNWKKRGWKKADKKTPENVELWQEIDQLTQKFSNLTLSWVKGHAGHPENEKCDQMANEALDDAGF